MNEEIKNDFFSFVSTDKNVISAKDLEKLETFINNREFDDIHQALNDFLNDLVYWSIQKLDLNVNFDEAQINKIAITQLKRNQSGKKSRTDSNSNLANGYQMLYKKNLEFKRIKNSEVKKSFRNMIKNKNIDLKITLDMLTLYFAENSTHHNTVLKFLTRMQTIFINQQLLLRQTSLNFSKKSTKKKSKSCLKKSNYKETERTDTNTNKTDDNISKFNKSNENDTYDGKSNKSCLSDNEVLMKSKAKFLNVLSEVTKNMIKEMQNEGKEINLKIEPEIMKETQINEENNGKDKDKDKEKDKIIIENKDNKENNFEEKAQKFTFKGNENQTIAFNHEIVRENEISINLNESKKGKNEEKSSGEVIQNVNNNNENKKDKKKKENCKCHCLIY